MKKINCEVRPLPSKPGANLITYDGHKMSKGGSAMNQALPEKHIVTEKSNGIKTK